jgi:hypothetical protein
MAASSPPALIKSINWCSMNSTRNFRAWLGRSTLLALAFAAAAGAQSGYIGISAPAGAVVVNASVRLSAVVMNLAGTPLDYASVNWSSSDATLATVSADGTVKGISPGDVTITAAEDTTGASASIVLHIIPQSIKIQPSYLTLHVGETATITPSALDAAGKAITGVKFEFRSGEPAVATVGADGMVTAVGEGFTVIDAHLLSASNNAALAATIQVQVLPAPLYKIRKVLSTDVTAPAAIAAYTGISAASSSEIASVVTLSSGAQAAILLENGKTKSLAVSGQVLPNAHRMVLHIDGIAANSKGDVAMIVEYPTQWCAASVIFIPHGKPEQELVAGNCYNTFSPRSLAEDGTILYRNNDQIFSVRAGSAPKLLFSLASQPTAKDPVRNVNDYYPSRAGTFIINANLNSGAHVYLYYDGKSLTQVYRDGDVVGSNLVSNIDNPVATADGVFYTRGNGPNVSVLLKVAPGPAQSILTNNTVVGSFRFGWLQGVADASSAGVLMICDNNEPNNFHRSLAVWDGSTVVELETTAAWGSMIAGAILPDGTAVYSAVLASDTGAIPLRTEVRGGGPQVLLPAGAVFPQPAPAGVDWHFASRGGGSNGLVFRGSGESIVNVKSSAQSLVSAGSPLPNGKIATWIGSAMGNQSGDAVFSAGFSDGSGLFRYRAGQLETLIDSTMGGKGPNGFPLSWVDSWYHGRYSSINSRGDVAAFGYYNGNFYELAVYDATGAHLVATRNALNPGGGVYSNFRNIAIDDKERVLFVADTTDGHTGVYYWDGQTVQRVISTGDAGPSGLAVNEITNISAAGQGFAILLAFGNYSLRELRSFDGSQMRTLQSTDTTVLDATGISYYWSNECTASANGDAHCMVGTQDGGAGVYAHRTDGRDLVVARSRDPLPDGEWMVMPLSVGSSANGEIWFTAYTYRNGAQALALYEATPQ